MTGASGFVGRSVCRALMAEGYAVRALVRRQGAAAEGVTEIVVRDMSERPALLRAFEGARAVVHLAARVHVPDSQSASEATEYHRVNSEGTGLAVRAAVGSGVERFIFMSSVRAVGDATPPGVVWRDGVKACPVDLYGASKLEAERFVMLERGHMPAVVLRPPLVYGPGNTANALALFRFIDKGVPLPLGGIRNRRSLIYVGNLAAAVLAAVKGDAASDLPYFVRDGTDVSTPELAAIIAMALGRRATILPMNPAMLQFAGAIAARLGSHGRRFSTAVRRLTSSLAVDDIRFRNSFDFSPPYPMREAMAITGEWFATTRQPARVN